MNLTFTEHARRRVYDRFPHLYGAKILAELAGAKPPTKLQAMMIADKSNRKEHPKGWYLVSASGIVFVIEGEAILTLYPLPSEDDFHHGRATKAAIKRQKKPSARYESRRQKDAKWKKEIEE